MMRDAVRKNLRQSARLVSAANSIIASVPPRDTLAQVRAIYDFTNRYFRYVNDPVGVELLRDPDTQIGEIQRNGFIQGDCDEAATLTAALGEANGIPARFRALAFYAKNAPYTHVVTDLLVGRTWYPMDVTKPPGMVIPNPTKTLTLLV